MFLVIAASDTTFHLRLFTMVVCVNLFQQMIADENPTVIYALIDQTVRLPCPLPRSAATPRVEWFDLVYNTDPKPKKIFGGVGRQRSVEETHPNRVNYIVDKNFTLFIHNIKLDDAGAYNCTSRQENYTLNKSYYLAVSGFPLCNGTNPIRVGQTGHYSCESVFSGNYQPHMEWQREPDNIWKSVDNFDVRLAKKVFDLDASEGDDGTTFTCRIAFGNVIQECNINLTVLYPVRDIVIDPLKDSFSVDEEIRCSANGSPRPEISFEPALTPGRTGFGWRSATIPKSLSGQKVKVECRASNFVDGQQEIIRKTISFTVESATEAEENGNPAPSKSSSSSSGPIIGGIVIGIMILVIIVAIVFCVRLRKDKKPAKEENGGAKTQPSARDETQAQIKENQV